MELPLPSSLVASCSSDSPSTALCPMSRMRSNESLSSSAVFTAKSSRSGAQDRHFPRSGASTRREHHPGAPGCRSMTTVVAATAYGGPESLSVLDEPVAAPGPGEVLLEVRAAGVNPADWK